jgi:hypothetical protein
VGTGTPPAEKQSERETIRFEGIRIVFPKGEADVVEALKPALRKYREERRRVADAEAKEIAQSLVCAGDIGNTMCSGHG